MENGMEQYMYTVAGYTAQSRLDYSVYLTRKALWVSSASCIQAWYCSQLVIVCLVMVVLQSQTLT